MSSSDTIDGEFVSFKEPAGLCVSANSNKIYLADTNNHLIKVITLNTEDNIENIELFTPKLKNRHKYQLIKSKFMEISPNGGELTIKLDVKLNNGLKLTEDAEQNWHVELPNPLWICSRRNGNSLDDIRIPIRVPGLKQEAIVEIVFDLVTCAEEKCFLKTFIVQVPINAKNDVKINEMQVNVNLDPNNVFID